ncbi:MAG: helix-turn-helix domain-containing protein [Desulfobulbus sp.]|jgi:hypothetical protein
MSDNEYSIGQKEAADFLQVSTKTISRYRKRGLPYRLILNPATGKQEVRFRRVDLERWDEGRQLLATYAREEAPAVPESGTGSAQPDNALLNELLLAYREQIELLRDQIEDMREQLARRDRQIDDLMRLMVGLQLEYKPRHDPAEEQDNPLPPQEADVPRPYTGPDPDLFQVVHLPDELFFPEAAAVPAKKVFSREQLTGSILRCRRNNKSDEEIARALNTINAATLSGQAEWTADQVRHLAG